jgi:hypothetical protein
VWAERLTIGPAPQGKIGPSVRLVLGAGASLRPAHCSSSGKCNLRIAFFADLSPRPLHAVGTSTSTCARRSLGATAASSGARPPIAPGAASPQQSAPSSLAHRPRACRHLPTGHEGRDSDAWPGQFFSSPVAAGLKRPANMGTPEGPEISCAPSQQQHMTTASFVHGGRKMRNSKRHFARRASEMRALDRLGPGPAARIPASHRVEEFLTGRPRSTRDRREHSVWSRGRLEPIHQRRSPRAASPACVCSPHPAPHGS